MFDVSLREDAGIGSRKSPKKIDFLKLPALASRTLILCCVKISRRKTASKCVKKIGTISHLYGRGSPPSSYRLKGCSPGNMLPGFRSPLSCDKGAKRRKQNEGHERSRMKGRQPLAALGAVGDRAPPLAVAMATFNISRNRRGSSACYGGSIVAFYSFSPCALYQSLPISSSFVRTRRH